MSYISIVYIHVCTKKHTQILNFEVIFFVVILVTYNIAQSTCNQLRDDMFSFLLNWNYMFYKCFLRKRNWTTINMISYFLSIKYAQRVCYLRLGIENLSSIATFIKLFSGVTLILLLYYCIKIFIVKLIMKYITTIKC